MHTGNRDNDIALSSIGDVDKTGGQTTTTKLKTKKSDTDSEEAILVETSVDVSYEDGHDRETEGRWYDTKSAVSHQPEGWTGVQRL